MVNFNNVTSNMSIATGVGVLANLIENAGNVIGKLVLCKIVIELRAH